MPTWTSHRIVPTLTSHDSSSWIAYFKMRPRWNQSSVCLIFCYRKLGFLPQSKGLMVVLSRSIINMPFPFFLGTMFIFKGFLENHTCRKRKSIPFKYFISNSETCHMRRSSSQNPLDTSNCKGRKLSNTIRIYVNLNQHCVL